MLELLEQRMREIAREEALKVLEEKEAAWKAAQITGAEFVEWLKARDRGYETYEQTKERLGLKSVPLVDKALD